MSSQTATDHHSARNYAAVLAAMAVAAAAGFWMSLTSRDMPGSEALTLEDGVDVVGIMLFGVLGIALVARDRAAGLGRALVLMAVDDRAGLLPARARRRDRRRSRGPARCRPHPQHRGRVGVRRRVLPARAVAALPLPDRTAALPPLALGRGCRDRRLRGGRASRSCSRPGPVDEDVPAWGDNPIGLDAAPRLHRRPRAGRDGAARCAASWSGWPRSSPAGCATADPGGSRWRGSRSASSSRWPAWPPTPRGDSVTVEVLMALAIFGAMLFGIGWPLLGPLGARAEAAEHDTSGRRPRRSRPPAQLQSTVLHSPHEQRSRHPRAHLRPDRGGEDPAGAVHRRARSARTRSTRG